MARRVARPPKAAFVTRLRSGQLPNPTARQLPDLSTSIWVEPSSTGDTRHRGALNGDSYRLATAKKAQRRSGNEQSATTNAKGDADAEILSSPRALSRASLRSSRRGDCSATPLTEPDMRARIRLFGSICQNSSDSWADTRGRLRSFHKVLSEAIRPANQDGG